MKKLTYQTSQDVPMRVFGYDIVVPKGTAITHHTACGYDAAYNFVDDLSFLDYYAASSSKVNGRLIPVNTILHHDAHYYGINVPAEFVEMVPVELTEDQEREVLERIEKETLKYKKKLIELTRDLKK